jgi:dihydropteroate synthase
MTQPTLRCGRFALPLDRPLVMGILNVTPDSFSDGGLHADPAAALAHARRMLKEGADIIDIGGESSRPGAQAVPLQTELDRILPVLEALRGLDVPLSVDTCKPDTMRAALAAGADMINDINALRAAGAVEAVAGTGCAVCLMHMQGEPRTMQQAPAYGDVVGEVLDFLAERVRVLEAAGIARERICVDPGFGFGKTTGHNYGLLRGLERFGALGVPILAGLSRKAMIGAATGKPAAERLAGSLAAALAAAARGARILRVHDVAATVDALRVWQTIEQAIEQEGDEA